MRSARYWRARKPPPRLHSKLEILLEAGGAASLSGDLAKVIELGEAAVSVPVSSERDRFIVAMMRGFGREYSGAHVEAQSLFADALRHARGVEDPRALIWASNVAWISEDDMKVSLEYINRAVERARERGLLSLLPLALEQQANVLISQSSYDLGYAVAEEGRQLSLELGLSPGWLVVNMASVEAVWGREADARRHAEEVLALAQRTSQPFLVSLAEWAMGFLELTLGRPLEATERLLGLCTGQLGRVHPIPAIAAVPDLVEAAVRAGRNEVPAEPMSRFRAISTLAPTDARLALLALCEALLNERPPEEAFTEATDRAQALAPFPRARVALLYDEWLRRERRREEARIQLRLALELFRRLGTSPWEDRAAGELRATGESARRRDASTLDDLTAQELQVATFVAGGMTNKEIAAQLFLSPRTIDYHLRKVFSKLGIASRTELVKDGLPERAGRWA